MINPAYSTAVIPAVIGGSFVPQGDHRVDAHGAAGGEIARHQGDRGEQQRDDDEGDNVERSDDMLDYRKVDMFPKESNRSCRQRKSLVRGDFRAPTGGHRKGNCFHRRMGSQTVQKSEGKSSYSCSRSNQWRDVYAHQARTLIVKSKGFRFERLDGHKKQAYRWTLTRQVSV